MRIGAFEKRKYEGVEASVRGAAILGVRGNRLTLVAGLMACMFSAVAGILFLSAVGLVLEIGAPGIPPNVMGLILSVAEVFLALFLVLPMVFGLYRVVLSMRDGEPFEFSSLFFYFGSLRAYGRGLGMTLLLLASIAPCVVLYGVTLIASTTASETLHAVVGLSTAPLVVLALFMSCRCYPFLTLALSDSDAPLIQTMRRAIRLTSHRVWSVFVFRMRRFIAFLLSLLSVGVVTLLHTLPLTLLASCEFTLLLAEKQDSNAYES